LVVETVVVLKALLVSPLLKMVEGEKEITKGRSNAIPRSLTMALKEERILRERNDE
jgi:hypothetical protein